VTFSYALLGALFLALVILLVCIDWYLWSEHHEPGTSYAIGISKVILAIYVGVGAVFEFMAALSRRYLVLGLRWRTWTIAASALLAACGIFFALTVTLTGRGGLVGGVVFWAVAFTCVVCASVLWRQRRASNNRWRGP
jgi:hypothetical protein